MRLLPGRTSPAATRSIGSPYVTDTGMFAGWYDHRSGNLELDPESGAFPVNCGHGLQAGEQGMLPSTVSSTHAWQAKRVWGSAALAATTAVRYNCAATD